MSEVFAWVVSRMNAARFAANLSRDLDEQIAAGSSFTRAHAYAVKREQAARIAAKHAAIDKMRALYEGRFRATQATTPPLAGEGWRIVRAPTVPHDRLERFVRDVFALGWHNLPWPGWHVRWGDLSDAGALGMTVMSAKLILVDERAHQERTWRQFLTTVVHELCHALRPNDREAHGAAFARTLDQAVAYVLGPDEPALHHPEPRQGNLRPTAWPVPVTTADGWEIR
jgi:hypothetical protein